MSSFYNKFQAKKPVILAFVGGLLVGPLISGVMGWQVRSSTVSQLVHTAAVHQQVKFCEMRARAAVAEPDKLDYAARYQLAEEWAKLPWEKQADEDVVTGCSNNLSESA